MKCRACDSENLKTFLDLGETPLANSFLSEKQLGEKENVFPLKLCVCSDCKFVQLTYIVPPELMFKNYLYLTSVSKTGSLHFTNLAASIAKQFDLTKDSLAVDIGSNDGVLLQGFQKFGVQTIGVEPAENVAKIAEANGVETINDFFNEKVVKEIISRKGQADVVTATNVFAHVNDIQLLIENVRTLLKDNGILVIEAPYLLDMLDKMTFDTIYHEHLSYISVSPLITFFRRQQMEVFRIEHVDIHGGSLRIFVKKKNGKQEIDSSVSSLLATEKTRGMDKIETYEEFAKKVYDVRNKLVKYLKDLKAQGKTIVAYTAPAKANTLLNFCNIGKEYIDYIVDDTPLKQNLYTPGTHIPVVSQATLQEGKTPDYILILACEILAKTKNYADKGVKFIIPLPEPKIVS